MSEIKKERTREELVNEFLSKAGEFKSFHDGMTDGEKKEFKNYLSEMRN
jgi:hypothetical protein